MSLLDNVKVIHKDPIYDFQIEVISKEKEIYWIEIMPVNYGFRIVLRAPESMHYDIHWCAGNKREDVLNLLKIAIVAAYNNDIETLPDMSRIKPFFKDNDFCWKLTDYYISNEQQINSLNNFNLEFNLHNIKTVFNTQTSEIWKP